jgi:phage shock protein PspC (stress-responsive transcriptional regulator)
MKRIILMLSALSLSLPALYACATCQRQQPKFVRGVLHGLGPDSQWDYVIVWIMIIITVFTLFFTVKWLIRPGEKNNDHIKNIILNNE